MNYLLLLLFFLFINLLERFSLMIIEMVILDQEKEILFIISSLSVSKIENISEEVK